VFRVLSEVGGDALRAGSRGLGGEGSGS